jgi:small subunit ribosomal protein S9
MSTPVTESPEIAADDSGDVLTDAEAVEPTEAAADAQGAEEVPADDEPAPAVVPAARRITSDRPVLTVGRRKEAIVRVRLVPGTGEFRLNGRSLESYFPNKVHQQLVKEPLTALDKDGAYDVIARLSGGGVTGQAGALRLGIARALIEMDEGDRPALKKAGFLTRDARVKERKKYGLKKARKAPQYSKR